jgi:hypothetical protein
MINTEAKNAFLGTARGKRCVTTLGKPISVAMLELVYTCVSQEIPFLDATKKHLARELCHLDVWNVLSKSETHFAGMCIAFLAEAELLPLRMHRTKSGKGPKFYWL